MKCAVWRGGDEFVVEDWPVPEVGAGEVLLKIAFCGMCGGDFRSLDGDPPSGAYAVGHILGHEYTGRVTAVGEGVTTVEKGDCVAGIPSASCGKCVYCRTGRAYLCKSGSRMREGAFAEYVAVPETHLYPLPDGVSLRTGALMEPLAGAINTVESSNMGLGSSVLFVGSGTIGLMMLQLALRKGVSLSIVSEPVAMKRALAKEFGADITVDPQTKDLLEVVREATGGMGVDTAIEAVRTPDTTKHVEATMQCFEAAGMGGMVLLHGATFEEICLSPRGTMMNKQLTIKSLRAFRMDKALKVVAELDLEPLISEFRLQDINEAVKHIRAGKGVKAVIRP